MPSASATVFRHHRRRKRPVTAHPACGAVLGVWGAALGGLSVMVLPDHLIEAAITAAGSDVLLSEARFALGGALAAVLGLGCLMLGQRASRGRGRRTAQRTKTANEPDLIDPAADLGSESLDAPLGAKADMLADDGEDADWQDEKPADDTAWLPAFLGEVQDEPTSFEAASAADAVAAAPDATPPRELDLGEFAGMPGRNAVWVAEPEAPPVPAAPLTPETSHTGPAAPAPSPAPTALARLRAVPPTELSLCEMVERLAAALQEYQAAHGDAAQVAEDSAQEREALLDEALGALGRVTLRGRAEQEPAAGHAYRAALRAGEQHPHSARGAA